MPPLDRWTRGGGLTVPSPRRLASRSSRPPVGATNVGIVCAVGAGADRTIEVPAELGLVSADADDLLPDRSGHGDSSTLGRGCGSAIATTQANGARQLSDEGFAFGIGLRGPFGISERPCLFGAFFRLR